MNLRIGLTQGYADFCGCWGHCARTFGPAQGSIATSWGSLMNVSGTFTPHLLLKKNNENSMRVGGSDLPPFESRGITPIELYSTCP